MKYRLREERLRIYSFSGLISYENALEFIG